MLATEAGTNKTSTASGADLGVECAAVAKGQHGAICAANQHEQREALRLQLAHHAGVMLPFIHV